jgi:hypothetical protein
VVEIFELKGVTGKILRTNGLRVGEGMVDLLAIYWLSGIAQVKSRELRRKNDDVPILDFPGRTQGLRPTSRKPVSG